MDVYTDRRHKNDLLNWLGTRHLGMTNCEGLKNITDEKCGGQNSARKQSVVWPVPYTCTSHVPAVLFSAATGHTA